MTEKLPAVTFYTAAWCGDCRRSEALLKALNVEFVEKDIEHSVEYTEEARAISGRTNIPVVLFADGKFLVEPSDPQLHAELVVRGLV